MHAPPISPCSLVCSPCPHQGRTVSQAVGDHSRILACGMIHGILLGECPESQQLHRVEGTRCLPPPPVLSPTCVNEGNWFIFQSVSPEGSLLVHTLSADFGNQFYFAVQSCGDFRPSSPSPLHRMPCGELFWLPTSGTAWVQCVCWPASNHLPSCWSRSIL